MATLVDGQHQTPHELISSNIRTVLLDVLNKLECRDRDYDYIKYKVEWLCTLILRLGGTFEDSILSYLLQAQQMLSTIEEDDGVRTDGICPTVLKTGNRGRPKFDISREQLEYFLEKGFKATEIAKMLAVSDKTIYRRLEEFGTTVRSTYSSMSELELDTVVRNILHDFPNSGYKAMRGHLLSKGHKVQEDRIREAMRRTDPEGTMLH